MPLGAKKKGVSSLVLSSLLSFEQEKIIGINSNSRISFFISYVG